MEFPQRKPNRLRDYDYSQNGAYFVTICTKDRRKILNKSVVLGRWPHRPKTIRQGRGKVHLQCL